MTWHSRVRGGDGVGHFARSIRRPVVDDEDFERCVAGENRVNDSGDVAPLVERGDDYEGALRQPFASDDDTGRENDECASNAVSVIALPVWYSGLSKVSEIFAKRPPAARRR